MFSVVLCPRGAFISVGHMLVLVEVDREWKGSKRIMTQWLLHRDRVRWQWFLALPR
jgi:hypothetical protein